MAVFEAHNVIGAREDVERLLSDDEIAEARPYFDALCKRILQCMAQGHGSTKKYHERRLVQIDEILSDLDGDAP